MSGRERVLVRPATSADDWPGEVLSSAQAHPTSHIGYLGSEPAGIMADLAGLEPLGLAGVLVAEVAGAVVGVLGAEWDTEPPRVWWHGPFVFADADWDQVAHLMYAHASELLPASVREEELAPDDRNVQVAAFARRHGFQDGEASAVLTRDLRPASRVPTPGRPPTVISDVVDSDQVAVLHDRLFPDTHTPGRRLGTGTDTLVLVAHLAGAVVGYVAAERQSDGTGYIDFLGVDETARGQGVGQQLLEAACDALHDRYGCLDMHLTVRETNAVARRLYARCGFTEERVLRPWRRGG